MLVFPPSTPAIDLFNPSHVWMAHEVITADATYSFLSFFSFEVFGCNLRAVPFSRWEVKSYIFGDSISTL